MALRTYGMLVVPQAGEGAVNLAPGHDPLDIYLRCAALSGASFRAAGYDWELVTDDAARLRERCAVLGIADLPLREIRLDWRVPDDLRFRSAHYKLELLTQFATGDFGERAALVDIDAICLAPLPDAISRDADLAGYDLTATMIATQGALATAQSLTALAGEPRAPAWWGGEFVLGNVTSFVRLADEIGRLWPRYLEGIEQAIHVGDEMVLTAALQTLQGQGLNVSDAGAAGAIARFWSSRTLRRQPPFAAIADRAILHLPSDKPFLAAYPVEGFVPAEFLASYRRYLARRIAPRRVAAMLAGLTGRARRFAPRL